MPDRTPDPAEPPDPSRVGDLRVAIRLCLALGLRDDVHARTLVPLGADLHGAQIRLDVALAGGVRAQLFLAPADGEPWLAAGRLLKLAIDGATVPAVGPLAARLQPALDRVEFARLAGLFTPVATAPEQPTTFL